jgi:hypothetical protein
VGLARDGNGAFLGSVGFSLVAPDGNVVHAWSPTPIAAYHDLLRRYALPLDTVPAGPYQLQVRVSTDREDLPAVYILPAAPVVAAVPVDVR